MKTMNDYDFVIDIDDRLKNLIVSIIDKEKLDQNKLLDYIQDTYREQAKHVNNINAYLYTVISRLDLKPFKRKEQTVYSIKMSWLGKQYFKFINDDDELHRYVISSALCYLVTTYQFEWNDIKPLLIKISEYCEEHCIYSWNGVLKTLLKTKAIAGCNLPIEHIDDQTNQMLIAFDEELEKIKNY